MEITQGLRDSPVRLPESTILGYRSKDASIRLALNRALLMARVQPINEGESPTGGKLADRFRKWFTSREHLLPVKWRSLAGSTASFQGGA